QVALHGDPLTPEEMDQLAEAASPVMKLRGAWTVVDPAVARRARRRLVREVRPAEALAGALTGVAAVERGAESQESVVVGASLLQVRDRITSAATRD
ncbi:SNF2 helicase-associated domain-containing protein, partial [Nocardioides abyssi]